MFQKLQVELLTENVRDGSFECDSDNVSVFINALEGAWKNKIKIFELTFTYGQMQNLILVADLLKACPKIKCVKLQILKFVPSYCTVCTIIDVAISLND